MTYNEVILSLAYNLAKHFDEVFHSAEMVVTDAQTKFPAIPNGNEWVNLSPTDQGQTLYIRRYGDDEVIEDLKLTGCSTSYKMRSLLRIVFFNNSIEKHDEILYKVMKSVLIANTRLRSVVRDKWKLLREESSGGDYVFGPTTAYFAIDIYVLWHLLPDTCEQDFCTNVDNPICSISS